MKCNAKFWLVPLIVLVTACGGSGSAEVTERLTIVDAGGTVVTPPTPQAGVDYRTFLLGASPVQMVQVEGRSLRNGHDDFPIESLRGELDLLKIVGDYIGIPYDIFAENESPPADHPWTIVARELAVAANSLEIPLILQLGLVRRAMVGAAVVDEEGILDVDLTWAPSCFDFTTPEGEAIGDAYVNYAAWLAKEMNAEYVVSFTEANLYYFECGGATPSWDRLVAIQRRSYDAIKAVVPEATVFASFNLEALYGDTLDGWNEAQYQSLAQMYYDTFAMASYPFGIREEDGSFITPYDLPSDYLSRVLTQHPEEKRLSMAETGWNNVSIAVGDDDVCFENFPYSEQSFAADYFQFLVNTAHEMEYDFISWFSFRDVLPVDVMGTCYTRTDSSDPDNDACVRDFWCQAINQAKNIVAIPGASDLFSEVVLKAFGAMGVKDYDGGPRESLYGLWQETLSLPPQHRLVPSPDESDEDSP